MKNKSKLLIISAVTIAALSQTPDSLASPFYGGLSFVNNTVDFKKSERSVNKPGLDLKWSDFSNISGFIGVDINNRISAELSHVEDEVNHLDGLAFNITSLNFNYDIPVNNYVSVLGITGINYGNFAFGDNTKSNGYGANIGVGLSFKVPSDNKLLNKISLRPKVVRSLFRDDNVKGTTLASLDIKVHF